MNSYADDPQKLFEKFYEEAITELKTQGSLPMREAIESIILDTTASNIIHGIVCVLVQKILESIYRDAKNKE